MRAEALIRAGRPGEASAILTRALETPGEYEARFGRYLRVTLAEALVEEPNPDHARIRGLLTQVLEDPGLDRKSLFGVLVVELERRVLAGEALGDAWQRYQDELQNDRTLLDPPWEVRALLARAHGLVRNGAGEEGLAHCATAISISEDKDMPALAARGHELVALVERDRGRLAQAREAHARARQRLEEAASRIGDEQLRSDFLSRSVFRAIRRSELDRTGIAETRLLAIYEMIHALNTESDPERVLESLLDMALRVVGAERGLILLREEGEDYQVHLARNLERETIEDAAQFSRGVVVAAGAGKPVLAIHADDDPRLKDLRSVSLFGIRSVLCVPLRSRGRPIGAVYLDNRSASSVFSAEDLRFLEAFADHAALALENARTLERLQRENRRLRAATEARSSFGPLVGRSAAMQRVYERIEQFAPSTLPVLILGETGTGKELVARSIHELGPRAQRAFLVENCAALAESLLESELFGHVRGAFTGAERDRAGLFEQADGGTLFLDELGDMSPAMQARLLRVVQEGELRRVGSEARIRVDVRLVAATHRDLAAEIAAGRFREDLLHRLQVLVLTLPPLRERPGDIPLLVDHFRTRLGRERGTAAPSFAAPVVDLLERHPWPGNVRQLENCLRRLVLLAGDGPVTLPVVEADDSLHDLLLAQGARPEPIYALARNEKDQIREALVAAGGNRVHAAKRLGISRATIFRKIKEYGLS